MSQFLLTILPFRRIIILFLLFSTAFLFALSYYFSDHNTSVILAEANCKPNGVQIEGLVASRIERIGNVGTLYEIKNCGNNEHSTYADMYKGTCKEKGDSCTPTEHWVEYTPKLAAGKYFTFKIENFDIPCGSAQTDIHPFGLQTAGSHYNSPNGSCPDSQPTPNPTLTATPTPGQYAELCKDVTISSATLTQNAPITITANASTSTIKRFIFGFYNKDNPFSPANPKPIYFSSNTPYVVTKDVNPTNTQTITVAYSDVNKPDLNWGSGIPKSIQVNAFFIDTNDHYSGPVPACVVSFGVVSPTLTPTQTVTPTHTPSPTKSPTPTFTHTPTVTQTPTSTPTGTLTPTNTPTLTPTPTSTATPTAQVTVTPTATASPTKTPTNTVTPTTTITPIPSITSGPTATISPKPAETTQLKLCKYEDDNGDGIYQNGEDVISWTFTYAYDDQTKTVDSRWWHIWTQGCAIVTVPTGKRIIVTEEQRNGWRSTALFADGSNTGNSASYSYTSESERIKVLWFLNTFTPTAQPSSSPTVTSTPTGQPSVTLTPTASPTHTPTVTPTASPTVTVTQSASPTSTPTVIPTVTATLTPTGSLTPTITQTPTITPTPPASCSNLAVNPSEGTAPLTVNMTGYGNDPRGAIQGYEFNFGDSSNNQQYTIQQDGNTASHVYNNPGTYTAQLRIKDSTGTWRNENGDCKRTITVRAPGQVLGATTELPKTGAALGGVAIASAVGWMIRRRFYIQ